MAIPSLCLFLIALGLRYGYISLPGEFEPNSSDVRHFVEVVHNIMFISIYFSLPL
jgi:hypothetical protein